MPKIKINDKEYDSESLSDNAKQQLSNLIFVQNEIKKLNSEIAVYKTAENSYSLALNKAIEDQPEIKSSAIPLD
mgnify:CR=1 FL=1